MGVNDKAEEELYLTAEQTLWLISEVRYNIIKTLLDNAALMDLDYDTKGLISRLKDWKEKNSRQM